MSIRAIRGATTISLNTRDEIFNATIELITQIIEKNDIKQEDMTDGS